MNKTSSKLQADLINKPEKTPQSTLIPITLDVAKHIKVYNDKDKIDAQIRLLLQFTKHTGKSGLEIITPSELLIPRILFHKLTNLGLPFMSQKEFTEILNMLHLKGIHGKRPVAYTSELPGWKEIKEKLKYLSPIEDKEKEIIFVPNNSVQLGANKVVGTFEAWLEIIKICEQSSRARLSVALALAAFVLKLLDEPSFGIFIHGMTSRGKTFCQVLGASVSGNIGEGGLPKFSSTFVGLEQMARGANDDSLHLDEFGSQGLEEGKDVAFLKKFIYTLMNGNDRQVSGHTKASQNRITDANLFTLTISSEELYKAAFHGQGVRLMSVKAEPDGFEDIFDYADENIIGDTSINRGKIITDFVKILKKNQGHAKKEFILRLEDDISGSIEKLEAYRAEFDAKVVEMGFCRTPEDYRKGKSLNICFAASALAIEFGILPWNKENTLDDILKCFKDILSQTPSNFSKSNIQTMDEIDLIALLEEVKRKLKVVVISPEKPLHQLKIDKGRAFLVKRKNAKDKDMLYINSDYWRELVPEFALSSVLLEFLFSKGILLKGRSNAYTSQVQNKSFAPKRLPFYVINSKAFLELIKSLQDIQQ